MRTLIYSVFVVTSVICQGAFAEDEPKTDADNGHLLFPAASIGLSYPLLVSTSVGVIVPVTMQRSKSAFSEWPALRSDLEIGLSGGSIAVGAFFPIGEYKAISIKTVRMRTWLWPFNEEVNRTYSGIVGEFALLSVHGGPKVGIGSFKESTARKGARDSFISVFLGVGW